MRVTLPPSSPVDRNFNLMLCLIFQMAVLILHVGVHKFFTQWKLVRRPLSFCVCATFVLLDVILSVLVASVHVCRLMFVVAVEPLLRLHVLLHLRVLPPAVGARGDGACGADMTCANCLNCRSHLRHLPPPPPSCKSELTFPFCCDFRVVEYVVSWSEISLMLGW